MDTSGTDRSPYLELVFRKPFVIIQGNTYPHKEQIKQVFQPFDVKYSGEWKGWYMKAADDTAYHQLEDHVRSLIDEMNKTIYTEALRQEEPESLADTAQVVFPPDVCAECRAVVEKRLRIMQRKLLNKKHLH